MVKFAVRRAGEDAIRGASIHRSPPRRGPCGFEKKVPIALRKTVANSSPDQLQDR